MADEGRSWRRGAITGLVRIAAAAAIVAAMEVARLATRTPTSSVVVVSAGTAVIFAVAVSVPLYGVVAACSRLPMVEQWCAQFREGGAVRIDCLATLAAVLLTLFGIWGATAASVQWALRTFNAQDAIAILVAAIVVALVAVLGIGAIAVAYGARRALRTRPVVHRWTRGPRGACVASCAVAGVVGTPVAIAVVEVDAYDFAPVLMHLSVGPALMLASLWRVERLLRPRAAAVGVGLVGACAVCALAVVGRAPVAHRSRGRKSLRGVP